MIAHRLSTVRNADLILVIEQGRLVESGRFDELVARGGVFAELAEQGKFAPDAVEDVNADGEIEGGVVNNAAARARRAAVEIIPVRRAALRAAACRFRCR